jgi:hypothetical protein
MPAVSAAAGRARTTKTDRPDAGRVAGQILEMLGEGSVT